MKPLTAQEAAELVRKAQQLLGDGEADEIIGVDDPQHAALIQGGAAEVQLLYAVLVQQCGLKNSAQAQRLVAQAQLVLCDLLHRAYAMGIKKATS